MLKEVSVIIPAYNAEKYLADTIQSVLAQSFPDFELILVNDGSTDSTGEVTNTFSGDPRVKVISTENRGVSAARNRGLQQATGKYIAFLDADDLWLPENLAEKVSYLKQHQDIALVHSDVIEIDGQGLQTGKIMCGKSGRLLDDLLLWSGTCIPGPSSILVKTDTARQLKGFDENLSTAADQDFFIRLSAHYAIGRVEKCLVKYRIHEQNMHKKIKLMEKDHLYVYKKADASGLFKSASFRRKCFASLYLILAGSWWVNGKNKIRGSRFAVLSILNHPSVLLRLMKKTADA